MRARSRFAWAVMAVAMVLPSAASAAVDPYGADELDLIAYRDQVRVYTSGVDAWEVWVCDTPDGTVQLQPTAIAAQLNQQLDPYFSWLSQNRYRPSFVAGSTVEGVSEWPDQPFFPHRECLDAVASATAGTSNGVLVVVDNPYQGGFATPGFWCDVASDCPATYPQNSRYVVVGGGTVSPVGADPAYLRTVAHEIGHAISFPHSYGGAVTFSGGGVYEYDNAMDVMSGGDAGTLDIGTHALNRYAAGWLDSTVIEFHRAGTLTYDLHPAGSGLGTELIVLPTDGPLGVYEVLGARVQSDFDSGLRYEGVEVYSIDQTAAVCTSFDGTTCWGLDRRTTPTPPAADGEPWQGLHVHGVGETFQIRGVTVQVTGFDGDAFQLSVAGNAVAQRFVDDDGNIHESAIAAIAQQRVTRGCTPTTDRYCPTQDVTRRDMAVFLIRAIGDTTAPTVRGTFPDVPQGEYYSEAVDRLAELGISTGYPDGTFRPGALVSRAEMAVFLTRAFDTLSEVAPAGQFSDVPVGEFYAGAAEGILAAGVTTGCATEPLRYCPSEPVKRDAMASFLARALGLGT